MEREVVFSGAAARDLQAIGAWIEKEAPIAANAYVQAIRSFCDRLALFPERGTSWDDAAPGLHTVPFRNSATILFAVQPERIVILGVLARGRDVTGVIEKLK